ncbi:glutathione S-transferase, carboxy-terminal domain protein (macronuclear) [Tetrahymena thermophila SB210]|uniref:Glutathione S-transferase, carboxy-terminal domain protein n=1 Tax=Tetrahymena thermophila (strain SB210) TaxID=312017 RepID=Q234T1_TETTS|nr:glutathione S-transferase, carboxy-terminal domain protein [Tetrahymena thermophila SB210]EAR91922.1 glutathione S-transferase, carboxy-terminal domain protein [Tetrahymena thermophila SB210]|eukprot:XP_001012167.1 glutathione S-transferase, carboxy-terminal domain protein [Tetrahymena thermophila SB210]
MEVFLDNTPESFLVEVYAHYTNLVHRKKVNLIRLTPAAQQFIQQGDLKIPNLPCLITPQGIISNPISICVYFSDISFTSGIMIGKNNDAQFLSYLDQCKRIQKNQEVQLANLNKDLESKVFLVGSHITLADIIVFAYTYHIITCLDDAAKWKFNNVFRWYNNVQNLEGMKEFIQNTNRSLSMYPEPLIESEDASAKGKGGKKK